MAKAVTVCGKGGNRTLQVLDCGDAFVDPEWPDRADIVFCTTTCFTPELRAALECGVARLRAGTRPDPHNNPTSSSSRSTS